MVKFKVLKYNQIFMSWLGIHSKHLNEPTNEFFKSFRSYYVLIIMTIAILSCGRYFFTNLSEVQMALGALKIGWAGVQCIGMFIGIGLKMEQIKAMHLKLQEIVDENPDFYWTTEQRCRKLTKALGSYGIWNTFALIFSLGYALYCISIGNYEPSTYLMFINMSIPFVDLSTMFGWFFMWCIQFNLALSYASAISSMTTFFMSCCFYINAQCDLINTMLYSIQANDTPKKNAFNVENNQQKKLSDAIKFQIKIIEWVLKQFLWCENKVYFNKFYILAFSTCWPISTAFRFFLFYQPTWFLFHVLFTILNK